MHDIKHSCMCLKIKCDKWGKICKYPWRGIYEHLKLPQYNH